MAPLTFTNLTLRPKSAPSDEIDRSRKQPQSEPIGGYSSSGSHSAYPNINSEHRGSAVETAGRHRSLEPTQEAVEEKYSYPTEDDLKDSWRILDEYSAEVNANRPPPAKFWFSHGSVEPSRPEYGRVEPKSVDYLFSRLNIGGRQVRSHTNLCLCFHWRGQPTLHHIAPSWTVESTRTPNLNELFTSVDANFGRTLRSCGAGPEQLSSISLEIDEFKDSRRNLGFNSVMVMPGNGPDCHQNYGMFLAACEDHGKGLAAKATVIWQKQCRRRFNQRNIIKLTGDPAKFEADYVPRMPYVEVKATVRLTFNR